MAAERTDPKQLEDLAARLREATWSALASWSALARSIDESRGEIERLLMTNEIDPTEHRRAIVRAEMMLNAWESIVTGPVARSR